MHGMLLIGLTALGTAPGEAFDVSAVHELIANPVLADGAAGWNLLNAEAVADAGPAATPAVELQPTDGEDGAWLGTDVSGVDEGWHLTLTAQVRGRADADLWAMVTAWGTLEDGGIGQLEEWSVHASATRDTWIPIGLELVVPPDCLALRVAFTHRSAQPSFVANAHLRVAKPGPNPDGTSADLSSRRLIEEAQAVRDRVAKIRQLAYEETPYVGLLERPTMRRHILEVRTSPEPRALAEQAALVQLGLWESGRDLSELSSRLAGELVRGHYVVAYRTVYLAAEVPAPFLPALMAHEMGHALDYQTFDMQARMDAAIAQGRDEQLAMTALVEGSANLVMMAYAEAHPQAGLEVEAQAHQYGLARAFFMDDVPDLLKRRLAAPYVLGVRFLLRGDPARRGTDIVPSDLDAALQDPPRSTEQILHPETYWIEELRDEPVPVVLPDMSPRLPGDGWHLLGSGTLGELQLAMLVGATLPANISRMDPISEDWTNAAASGWGGDRWQVYSDGDATIVLLATVWDTEADADEFLAALRLPDDTHRVHRGRAVVLVLADGGVAEAAGDDIVQAALEALPE